jgi:hypothetical protein
MNPPPPTASLWGKHHHRHRAETNIIHYYPWNGHSLYTLYLLYMYVYIYVYIYIYIQPREKTCPTTRRAHMTCEMSRDRLSQNCPRIFTTDYHMYWAVEVVKARVGKRATRNNIQSSGIAQTRLLRRRPNGMTSLAISLLLHHHKRAVSSLASLSHT